MGEVDQQQMRVWTLLENYAKVSTRRSRLVVFASTFNRITGNELKWHLDQIRVGHHLTEILKHN